jgi:NADH-quinone oxidoreductase subunit B
VTVTNRARSLRLTADPTVAIQDLGLACCVLEVEAAVHAGLLRPDAEDAPPARTVLLVSGTVTKVLAPAVTRAIAEAAGQVTVISVGACASTGGPYWDAPSVLAGVDEVVSVGCYVPGCPPRPEALVAAIVASSGRS